MRTAIASAYGEYRRVRVRHGFNHSAWHVARLSTTAWQECAARLRAWYCVLTGGHFSVLYTERDRLALRCVGCRHQSPGWEIRRKK
jgi:hypothetical protein